MLNKNDREEFTVALQYAIESLCMLKARFIIGTQLDILNQEKINSLESLRDYIIMQPLFK
jgi:hypothetical protein